MSGDRRDRRLARARIGLDVAIFLAGAGVSLWLLGRPSLAMAALWVALFIATTAYAILQRETPR